MPRQRFFHEPRKRCTTRACRLGSCDGIGLNPSMGRTTTSTNCVGPSTAYRSSCRTRATASKYDNTESVNAAGPVHSCTDNRSPMVSASQGDSCAFKFRAADFFPLASSSSIFRARLISHALASVEVSMIRRTVSTKIGWSALDANVHWTN